MVRDISPQQIWLSNILKNIFPDVELEYPIGGKVNKKGFYRRWADVAIPSLKIDFEYDGRYSHDDTVSRDSRRDYELEEQGWETIRINYDILFVIEAYSHNIHMTPEKFLNFVRQITTRYIY